MTCTFIVPVNQDKVFERNFLASPVVAGKTQHELIVQRNFPSAARAYNDALDRASNEIVVLLHQDVFLPRGWDAQLEKQIEILNGFDANWGVLGCWGVTKDREEFGHLYTTHWGVLGRPFPKPVVIQTLDEFVLILRRSSGLRFDSTLPHYHFYGTDICMTAAKQGMKSYAISAFSIHNTSQLTVYPTEFYQCYQHVKNVWRNQLPIETSCTTISRHDWDLRKRRLKQIWFRLRPRPDFPLAGTARETDPVQIMAALESTGSI